MSHQTAKDVILQRLASAGKCLAVHEFNIMGYSENCLATRVSELAVEGKLFSRYREGKRFKEWGLTVWNPQMDLAI